MGLIETQLAGPGEKGSVTEGEVNVHHFVTHKALAIFMMCFLISCGESYEQRQAKENAVREEVSSRDSEKRTQDIQSLAQQYNADAKWSEGLPKGPLTTAVLSTILKRTDGRPLVVRGLLIDIAAKGSSHKITFRTSDLPELSLSGQHLLFEVTCPLSASEVNALRPGSYRFVFSPPDLLAVVTNIKDVTSTHSIIGGHIGDNSETIFQSVFTAIGDCISVRSDRRG